MDQSRTLGTALMAASAVQMLIFTIAVTRRSYLAVALPVFAAVATLSGVLFWIGYTMTNMAPDLGDPGLEEDEEARAS